MRFAIFIFIFLTLYANADSIKPPQWNDETLRWYVFSDNWHLDEGSFNLKGNYFQVSLYEKVTDQSEPRKTVQLFLLEKPDLAVVPSVEITEESILENGKEICRIQPSGQLHNVKQFNSCSWGGCVLKKESSSFYEKHRSQKLLSTDGQKCKYDIPYKWFPSNGHFVLNFKYENVLNEGKILKIKDSPYFLLIDFCRLYKEQCNYKGYVRTQFEDRWLKEIKPFIQNKNLTSLNELIQNLLPCVEKKDIQCVKSFFVTDKDFKSELNYGHIPHDKELPATVFDDSLLRELKSCLKYEKLLHVSPEARYAKLVLKGEKKACVVSHLKHLDSPVKGSTKILYVDVPETIQGNEDSEIRVVID